MEGGGFIDKDPMQIILTTSFLITRSLPKCCGMVFGLENSLVRHAIFQKPPQSVQVGACPTVMASQKTIIKHDGTGEYPSSEVYEN